jgi:hypothetical protein
MALFVKYLLAQLCLSLYARALIEMAELNLEDDVNQAEQPAIVARDPERDNAAEAFQELERPVYSQDDPRRMELSEQERNRAINIKEAIARTDDLDPVSDFMCAQLALIDGSNIERALERVQHMQHFKEEYGILDTLQHGGKCLIDYIDLFPRLHLSFSYCWQTGTYVMMYDNKEAKGRVLNSEERIRAWLGGVYYTCQSVCCDFAAIRCGTTLVFEYEG